MGIIVPGGAPNSGAGGGAWTKIDEQLLAAAANSIDFTNIPQTYDHLVIIGSLCRRIDQAGVVDVRLRLNNDSTGNYSYDYVRSAAGAVTGANNWNETSAFVGDNLPGVLSDFLVYLTDYIEATQAHAIAWQHRYAQNGSGNRNYHGVGGWGSVGAINRVTIFHGGGGNQLGIGSHLSLYGIS